MSDFVCPHHREFASRFFDSSSDSEWDSEDSYYDYECETDEDEDSDSDFFYSFHTHPPQKQAKPKEPGVPDRPAPPRLLESTDVSMKVGWDVPLNNGAPIIYYSLEMDTGVVAGANFHEIYRGKKRSYEVKRLTPGTTYHFLVKAANKYGSGGFSRVASFMTQGSAPKKKGGNNKGPVENGSSGNAKKKKRRAKKKAQQQQQQQSQEDGVNVTEEKTNEQTTQQEAEKSKQKQQKSTNEAVKADDGKADTKGKQQQQQQPAKQANSKNQTKSQGEAKKEPETKAKAKGTNNTEANQKGKQNEEKAKQTQQAVKQNAKQQKPSPSEEKGKPNNSKQKQQPTQETKQTSKQSQPQKQTSQNGNQSKKAPAKAQPAENGKETENSHQKKKEAAKKETETKGKAKGEKEKPKGKSEKEQEKSKGAAQKKETNERTRETVTQQKQQQHEEEEDVETEEVGSSEEKDDGTVVRLRGLPWEVTREDIRKFFSGLGIAGKDGICIALNFDARPTGDGFVRFINAEQAKAALARHMNYMGRRYICVERSTLLGFNSCSLFAKTILDRKRQSWASTTQGGEDTTRESGNDSSTNDTREGDGETDFSAPRERGSRSRGRGRGKKAESDSDPVAMRLVELQGLQEMGFGEEEAIEALRKGLNLELTIEWLLEQRGEKERNEGTGGSSHTTDRSPRQRQREEPSHRGWENSAEVEEKEYDDEQEEEEDGGGDEYENDYYEEEPEDTEEHEQNYDDEEPEEEGFTRVGNAEASLGRMPRGSMRDVVMGEASSAAHYQKEREREHDGHVSNGGWYAQNDPSARFRPQIDSRTGRPLGPPSGGPMGMAMGMGGIGPLGIPLGARIATPQMRPGMPPRPGMGLGIPMGMGMGLGPMGIPMGPGGPMTPSALALDSLAREKQLSSSLWIGNVSPKVREEELRALFVPFGEIVSLKILRRSQCAFVNYSSPSAATAAKRHIQGKVLRDMRLEINFSKPPKAQRRDERLPPPPLMGQQRPAARPMYPGVAAPPSAAMRREDDLDSPLEPAARTSTATGPRTVSPQQRLNEQKSEEPIESTKKGTGSSATERGLQGDRIDLSEMKPLSSVRPIERPPASAAGPTASAGQAGARSISPPQHAQPQGYSHFAPLRKQSGEEQVPVLRHPLHALNENGDDTSFEDGREEEPPVSFDHLHQPGVDDEEEDMEVAENVNRRRRVSMAAAGQEDDGNELETYEGHDEEEEMELRMGGIGADMRRYAWTLEGEGEGEGEAEGYGGEDPLPELSDLGSHLGPFAGDESEAFEGYPSPMMKGEFVDDGSGYSGYLPGFGNHMYSQFGNGFGEEQAGGGGGEPGHPMQYPPSNPTVPSSYGLFGWQPKPFGGSNVGGNHLSLNIWGSETWGYSAGGGQPQTPFQPFTSDGGQGGFDPDAQDQEPPNYYNHHN